MSIPELWTFPLLHRHRRGFVEFRVDLKIPSKSRGLKSLVGFRFQQVEERNEKSRRVIDRLIIRGGVRRSEYLLKGAFRARYVLLRLSLREASGDTS